MESGELYWFEPVELEFNPERGSVPFVGLFLQLDVDESGWLPTRYRVLGPMGVSLLWSSRWAGLRV